MNVSREKVVKVISEGTVHVINVEEEYVGKKEVVQ